MATFGHFMWPQSAFDSSRIAEYITKWIGKRVNLLYFRKLGNSSVINNFLLALDNEANKKLTQQARSNFFISPLDLLYISI